MPFFWRITFTSVFENEMRINYTLNVGSERHLDAELHVPGEVHRSSRLRDLPEVRVVERRIGAREDHRVGEVEGLEPDLEARAAWQLDVFEERRVQRRLPGDANVVET